MKRLFLFFAATAGCHGIGEMQSNDASDATLPPSIVVGTGEHEFTPLELVEGVALTRGPQGGYHIWLAVSGQSLGPVVQIRYGVQDATTGDALTIEQLSRVVDVGAEDVWTWAGLPGFLECPNAAAYFGRQVTLWATVIEDGGDLASDERQTTVLTTVKNLE